MIYNKKIFIIFLIFLFTNFETFADNLKNYQIENISLGESALNHFSQNAIEKKKSKGFIYPKKDFFSVTFYRQNHKKFETYDAVQLHLKANDNKYKIYSIAGRKFFHNNFEGCEKTLNFVLSDIQNIFKNSRTIDRGVETWTDTDGYKVKTKSYWIKLKSGEHVSLECYDQPEEKNIKDGLNIALDSKIFFEWLTK